MLKLGIGGKTGSMRVQFRSICLGHPAGFAALCLLFAGCATHQSALQSLASRSFADCSCAQTYRYTLFPEDVVEVVCVKDYRPIDTFRVQVEDEIRLSFLSFPEYSIKQPVKPDGTISLPRTAPYRIQGKTVDKARDEIAARYREIQWEPEFFLTVESFDMGLREIRDVLSGSPGTPGRDITVRPDGFISLPLIGELAVGGKDIRQVTGEIQEKYSEHYPRLLVDVQLVKAQGNEAYIYGDVGRPGAYPLGSTKSIMELISRAGGLLPTAYPGNIVIMSVSDSTVKVRRLDLKGKAPGQSGCLLLCPGDVVFVPKRAISSLAHLTSELGQILFFRGFGVGFNWTFTGATTLIDQ